jgi:hypothetical protein
MPAMHPEITCNEGAHGEADVFPNTMTSPPANKGITGSVMFSVLLACGCAMASPLRCSSCHTPLA